MDIIKQQSLNIEILTLQLTKTKKEIFTTITSFNYFFLIFFIYLFFLELMKNFFNTINITKKKDKT